MCDNIKITTSSHPLATPQSHALQGLFYLAKSCEPYFFAKDDLNSAYPSLRHFSKVSLERFTCPDLSLSM